jgi:hypothetical protein
MTPQPSIWGRYPDETYAKLAMRQYLGDPDEPSCRTRPPFYRVRYTPSERWPDLPWAICAFEWPEEADMCDANGVVS